MTTFKEFIQNKQLESRLPFGIDFSIQGDFDDYPTETVAGFELPLMSELTSGEHWFLELVGSQLQNRRQELQMRLLNLNAEFKDALGVDSRADAGALLFGSLPEELQNPQGKDQKEKKKRYEAILDSEEYEKFVQDHFSEIQDLQKMADLIDNDVALSWLRVSFLMLSRYDGNWTLGKTAGLPNSKIKALEDFINREANGGKQPEQVPEQASDEEEDVGKQSQE